MRALAYNLGTHCPLVVPRDCADSHGPSDDLALPAETQSHGLCSWPSPLGQAGVETAKAASKLGALSDLLLWECPTMQDKKGMGEPTNF